jgi:hypothetical protein
MWALQLAVEVNIFCSVAAASGNVLGATCNVQCARARFKSCKVLPMYVPLPHCGTTRVLVGLTISHKKIICCARRGLALLLEVPAS